MTDPRVVTLGEVAVLIGDEVLFGPSAARTVYVVAADVAAEQWTPLGEFLARPAPPSNRRARRARRRAARGKP